MHHLTAPQLADWIADASRPRPVLLDVREPWEYQTCHIEGALLIPMNTVPGRQAELNPDVPVVCICHHGSRSMKVAAFLELDGFADVSNLTGGIHAWAQQVDGSMPVY